MGTVDNGTQTLSYDYRDRGLAETFNKINYKLHSQGIYTGGGFTRVSDSSITIAPFICFYDDTTNKIGVRIETTTNATVTGITSSLPWIVGRYTWENTEDNYMDIIHVAKASILATDIIFGFVDYSGTTMTSNFDYTAKSWDKAYYLNKNENIPFRVIADEPYANNVVVQAGGPYLVNGKWIELTVDTDSPNIVFPISSYGRKDVIAINSDTNTVAIIQGSSTSNTLPEIDSKYFVVAVLNLPASITSTIRGDYIEYIHPNRSITTYESSSSLLTKIKTIDGTGSGIDLDTFGSYHSSSYVNDINNIIEESPFIQRTLPNLSNLYYMTYGNNTFVGVVIGASLVRGTIVSTDGGLTWNYYTSPGAARWQTATYGNGVFVKLYGGSSSGTGHEYSTDNGVNWTIVSSSLPSAPWISVTYGNGTFVAIAQNSTIAATSYDGITWTQRTLPVSAPWIFVTYGNGTFVAIAGGTSLSTIAATSPDGITWTQRVLPVSLGWQSVTYGNGIFVAVAYDSSIAVTSPDGVTWTQRTLPVQDDWKSIAYGNGLFIAVATETANNFVAVSHNGIDWSNKPLPPANLIFIAFGDGAFAISGANCVATKLSIPLLT